MARDKVNQVNIDKSDLVKYPNGRLKNNTGSGNGTPINEEVYGDIHETLAKLMRLYGISYNNLPDNETNGYQIVEALISLATKNDFIHSISSTSGVLSVPLKLSKLKNNEMFILKASVDKGNEITIKGSLDNTVKTVNFVGNFKANEYVRMINTSTGVTLIRMVDSFNLESQINDLNFLLAATGLETIEGLINSKGVTPVAFLEAFTNYVNGDTSGSFLATDLRNGLISKEDKSKLDDIGDSNDKYGSILIGDANTGNIGYSYPVSGDIDSAVISVITGAGRVIDVSLSSDMVNSDYIVRQYIQSLGNIEGDNDIKTLVFKVIDKSSFQIYVEETNEGIQNIKVHLEIIQK